MKLTNSMEQVVRMHVKNLRAQSPAGDESCWCPLCRADMMALALSALPPRYATRRPGDSETGDPAAVRIRDGVVSARKQVDCFPKHAPGAAVAAGKPVWVVNFPLEEGFRVVDEILRRNDRACDCWNCRCDMVAFALNRYPARYGVEHEGQTQLFEKDRAEMCAELAEYLELAVRVVTTVPRHKFTSGAPVAAGTLL